MSERGTNAERRKEHQLRFRSQLAALITTYRERANLSKGKLAELVGVTRPHISALESANSNISMPILFEIAYVCEIPIHLLYDSWLATRIGLDEGTRRQLVEGLTGQDPDLLAQLLNLPPTHARDIIDELERSRTKR